MMDWQGTPKDFDDASDKKISSITAKLKKDTADLLQEANKKYEENKEEAESLKKLILTESLGNYASQMLTTAFVVSLIVFFYILMFTSFSFCSSTEEIVDYAASVGETLNPSGGDTMEFVVVRQFGLPGVAFVATFIVACLVIYGLIKSKNSIRQKEIDKLDASAEEIKLQASKKIEELEEKAKSEIAKIEQEKMKYRSDFENERRVESVKYANSPVAKEVIDLISTGFKNQIDACDRRPHIKEIIVPLSFKVYATKIETPYGVYDFELQRVSKLSGMKEQTSLANAIAQSVHTDIFTTYPVDISGGEVKPLEIGINYGPDWVEAVMTYHADNANYIPERSF